jgi:hypothetical protein
MAGKGIGPDGGSCQQVCSGSYIENKVGLDGWIEDRL